MVMLAGAPPAAAATYTVQPGDTLYIIGQRYGIDAWTLQQNNGLTSSAIYPGQKLWVPDSGSTGSGSGATYTVRAGDSLYLIGQRFGVTAQAIMQANGLTSTYIYVGQRLWIPGGSSGSSRGGYTSPNLAKDRDLLARLIYGEARGEPYQGQVAVAAVALNRVKSPLFPNTLEGVIYEPDAFTSINDGQFWLTPNSTAYNAASEAIAGKDPTGGALFFWNPATAVSGWVWTRTITTQIGNHVFAI